MILKEEIESINCYLHQEAVICIKSLPVEDKDDLSGKFLNIVKYFAGDYADKHYNHYRQHVLL